MHPFTFPGHIFMCVGDGPTMERVKVPLEVRAYWWDGSLEVIRARVTQSAWTEDRSFRVRNAGELHQLGPGDRALLQEQAEALEQGNQLDAQVHLYAEDFDQRAAA